MITWMQHHKKWLIITIWVSTIAFVGAGFVGWGAYDFGKSQGTVAQVGEREISISDLQQEYGSMYNQYKQMFGETFNDEAAKNMNLENVAMQSLIQKNLYLSYADEIGMSTTDEEVAKEVVKINAFHKDGKFDKETYITVLAQNKTNPTEFEKNLKDGILLEKIKLIFSSDINLQEIQNVGQLFFLEDKIKMEIIDKNSITVNADEASLKEYYEKNKMSFKTPSVYNLSYSEIATNGDVNRTKEGALREYLKLKKGEAKFATEMTVAENQLPYMPDDAQKIKNGATGDIIKPFLHNGKYVIIKINKKIEPRTMSYEEAKPLFIPTVIKLKQDVLLKDIAAKKVNSLGGMIVDGITRESVDKIPGLTQAEANSFLTQLFSATTKNGYILLDNKAVVYNILESKFGRSDQNKDVAVYSTLNNIKDSYKFDALVQKLQAKYEVTSYMTKEQN